MFLIILECFAGFVFRNTVGALSTLVITVALQFLKTKPAKHSKIIKNIPNTQIGIDAFIASNISKVLEIKNYL